MNPSSLSTWARATLSLVAGMSTAGRSIRLALRIRVSMSAIGSVIMVRGPPLPAGLLDARDQPVAGQVAEADAADAELAVDGPGPAAEPAAAADADQLPRLELLGLVRLLLARLQGGHLALEPDHFGFGRHG